MSATDRITVAELEALLLQHGIDVEERPEVRREISGFLAGADATHVECAMYVEYAPADSVVAKALTGSLAVPRWREFCADVTRVFEGVKADVTGGANATYIPILAEADPQALGVAVCTVDGQQFQIGDWDGEFSIQSCVKPLMYAVAVDDNSVSTVHRRVGIEPSGLSFNEVSLNADNLPHNPMINSGAIASGSLILPDADSATRFSYFMEQVSAVAGDEHIGFSQPTYLCEHETAWRNNALMYYMQDAQVFPPSCNIEAVLDFYIQCCAIEVNARVAANIASTLANGGISPLTKKKVLSPVTVKATLTLMFSCGMYDYSGEWCVNVGLPAKSGVAGLIYVVVPHVMGIAVWSPPLDERGNSVRGVEFFKRLLNKYSFGIFDQIVDADRVVASKGPRPRRLSTAEVDGAPVDLGNFEVHERVRCTLRRLGALHLAFRCVGLRAGALSAGGGVPRDALVRMLAQRGIDASSAQANPRVFAQLEAMARGHSEVRFRALVLLAPFDENLVARALLRALAVPVFDGFAAGVAEIFRDAEHDTGGATHSYVSHLDEDAYGMAVCTVDGQMSALGDSQALFPLLSSVKPLLYAMALEDLSVDEVHEYVGNEPTSSDPCGFSMLRGSPPKPFNPFMDSGALAVCSLIGRGHEGAPRAMFDDSGSRFTHIVNKLSAWAGHRKLQFDQPTFLAQQEYGLQLKAVAQFMKGMGCFTQHTDPTDVAKLFFQCCSIELNCETLSIVASTLANMGRCPMTGEQVLPRHLMRQMLSVMYSCGMSRFAGKWNFSVGIPARAGQAGVIMLVIPNIMGVAIFSPRVNEYAVSKRGLAVCEALTAIFRVNLFDQLVYADEDIKIDDVGDLFLDLCTAAGNNNSSRVRSLIQRGADVACVDYDSRTALHIACAAGAVDVVPLLLAAGADPLLPDRWETTPLDDAVRSGHGVVVGVINSHLER